MFKASCDQPPFPAKSASCEILSIKIILCFLSFHLTTYIPLSPRARIENRKQVDLGEGVIKGFRCEGFDLG